MIRYRLSLALLLILGLLNPASGNVIDTFIAFLIFSFVAYTILKSSKVVLFGLVIVSWLIFTKVRTFDLVIVYASIAGSALGFILERLRLDKKLAVGIVIVAFLVASLVTSDGLRQLLSRDLPLYSYNNDPGVFLKTYQLIKHGGDYYQSFVIADKGRFAQQWVPDDIWGVRLPTIFIIWKILPGASGLSIYVLYLVLASTILYLSFDIGSKYLGFPLSILPSYLIFPYLHFAARDQMLLETEWWSVAFFIIALYFLIKKKWFWATLVLSLTVMVRELYVLPVGLMLIYCFFKKRRLLPVFLIPLLAFLSLFLFHINAASSYIDSWGTLFKPRVVPFGLFFVNQTLAFASWEYLLFSFRPFLLFLIAAVLGCWYVFKEFEKDEAAILLLSFLLFPIAFLRFGGIPYNDYWGIVYVPVAILLSALSIGLFKSEVRKS